MGQTTQQQRDDSLSEFRTIAAEWSGEWLSRECVNQNTKLWFQCSEGHQMVSVTSERLSQGLSAPTL
jgi:hypothetical protein